MRGTGITCGSPNIPSVDRLRWLTSEQAEKEPKAAGSPTLGSLETRHHQMTSLLWSAAAL